MRRRRPTSGRYFSTNALSQTTVTKKNAQGLVSSIANALNKTTSYAYDAYGDVLTVTDPVGNQIVNTYDLRGNKLTSSDPDLGLWAYSYDALGELLTQVDPNERAASASTALAYDGLGRLHQRTEPDQTSVWTYDTAAHGAGLLASATGSNAGYGRAHTYDSLSRPTKVTLTINTKTYVYNRTYNSDSRLATLSYPSGLVVQYVYTPLGYLSQLRDNATGAVLWTANARDAEMHLTDQLAGNGVDTLQVFDPLTGLVQQIRASADGSDDGTTASFSYQFDKIGNLSNRSDNYGSTENFCYDPLNRLTNYSVNGATCRAGGLLKSVAYDDTGNITNKSDLADTSGGTGAYTYANPGNPLPHAVKSISGTANGVTNPGFRYDLNGNLTCEYTGPNCSHGAITKETDAYWSFNMAHTISDGSTSLTLTYDSEHARVTQALTTASTTTTTTYLNDPVSGAMSEKAATGLTVTWNDYLMVDGKLIGEHTCSGPTPPCTGGATWQYFVLDHLGSVAVVTNGTAAVTSRESFDAWGKQRNEDGSDDVTCSNGLTSPTTKGFTSQEEIAALCLVNLNARIYDPTIGRFMAADTMVPDAYDGQSYNRYTYTDNRPLSFTDPTGHEPDMSQNFIDAHPEMECMGNCGGGVAVLTGTMTAPDGFVLGSYKIMVNTNGNMAMNMDCGEGCGSLGNMVASAMGSNFTSISDSRQTFSTSSAQNTNCQIATAPPGATQDDTVNGNGTAKGMKVSLNEWDPKSVKGGSGFVSSDLKLLGIALAAYFHLNHRASSDGGEIVQYVSKTVLDRNGNPVPDEARDYSEAWRVDPYGTATHMASAPPQAPRDDLFGALVADSGITITINATLRYYDGMDDKTLRQYQFQSGGAAQAGTLMSKYGPPGLPTDNASAVTIRPSFVDRIP